MGKKRDDFKASTINALRTRVASRCSNPTCRVPTTGPTTDNTKINNIGTQCRLIKGTVLLWEGAPDWHCLWDEQGEIDRTGWKG